MLQRAFEHARCAIGNLVDLVIALDVPENFDRFRQCPRHVDRGALGDQRLVQMNMRLDKAGNGHSALRIEREACI